MDTYIDRLCKLFGQGASGNDLNRMVLLLYTPRPNGMSYVLKSWGTRVPYTIIKADTLCQMEYAR